MIAIASATVSGCAPVITHFMVGAPNKGTWSRGNDPPAWLTESHGVDVQLRIDVGPPEASLLVWVTDPPPEALEQLNRDGPKGTVLVVHGYRNEMYWMLGKARDLNDAGYRSVLVDLRGHGCSTGDHLTYGVQEAKDLSQVISALHARGLIEGPVGVWGISYGASTAIMLAAEDPRIRAVVAVSPFSSMREIVPHYVRLFLPWVGWHMSDAEIGRIVDGAAERAGFDPGEADMVAAVRADGRAGAPLLLLHGAWDWLVPPSHSARIHAAAVEEGRASRRIVVEGTGHITIWFDAGGEVREEGVKWLDRWLAEAAEGN